MIAVAAVLMLGQAAQPVVVRIEHPADDQCRVIIESKSFDAQGDDAARDQALAGLPAKSAIHLVAAAAMPYRCIISAIYVLQRAGHADVTFVSDGSSEQ